MSGNFFEKNFDINDYIAKRTLEIKNLEDRSIYKEITQNMLVDLYRYHETSYENLCNEIMNEIDPIENENPIYLGITRYSDYDETDEFLYPMIETDFYEKKISIADIENSLIKNNAYEIGKLYFNGDLQSLNDFKSNKKYFDGKITTTKGDYFAKFAIEFDTTYIDEIEKLYESFKFNLKKWFPICTAYQIRFFKISIIEIAGNTLQGTYLNFSINFLENDYLIELDTFPVWNICKNTEITSIYPKPVKEQLVFEHKIFSHFLVNDSTYLLSSDNPDILKISRNKGDLLIRTSENLAVEWKIIEVKSLKEGRYRSKILSSEYAYKDIDKFLSIYKSQIKTKAELIRFSYNLPFGDYIALKDFSIIKNTNENYVTYNADEFEKDEIRTTFDKTLVLYFEKTRKSHIFISDFMSLYVTHTQKLFPEYRCVGQLV